MARRGNQAPTYRFCADYTRTEGGFAAEMAAAYGIPPHPWQRTVLDDWLALDERGKLLNSRCLLPVPRQNGKTGVSDPRETWGLVKRCEAILHTAQEYQTARKAFQTVRKKFGACKDDPFAEFPELNVLVERYTTSANQMLLELTNGASIEFRTRGTGTGNGRGGTYDLVVIDEAQEYTEEQDAAISPLVSAAPHGSPQLIFMGTVPDVSGVKGKPWRRLRDKAHTRPRRGTCIDEWAASEIGDPYDKDRWYRCDPSLGYQLLEEALAGDADSMSAEKFAMEHLGWWPPEPKDLASEPVIGPDVWESCAVDEAPPGDATAFGVKFAADGAAVSISAAILIDGIVYVELVATRPISHGTGWIVSAMKSKPGAVWVVDGKSGAHALVERAKKNEDVNSQNVREVTSGDAIAAAATFADSANEKRLIWCRAYGDALTESVTTSTRRKIGAAGGWGFGGANPTPCESAALATWAALNVDGEDMEVYF